MQAAPFYDDIANGPEGGSAHWLKTQDGVRIRVGHWPKADAKGTVLIFPGRTEFIEKYGMTAKAMHDHGFASLAIDWRGQGLADRLVEPPAIGHGGDFADYQHDVAATLSHAKALGLPEPYYMIAHSMGGCIGLRTLMDGSPFRAVMFSAPMWGVIISAPLRPVAWGLSAISMQFGFDHKLAPSQVLESYVARTEFSENTLTNDAPTWALLQEQLRRYPALGLGGPSMRWIYQSLSEMRDLHRMPSPDIPALAYLGSDEAIVDAKRIHDRMRRWRQGTLHVIDGGKHEMLMDAPQLRDTIHAQTAAFFVEHT